MDELVALLQTKQIDRWGYDSYVLFWLNEVGRTYLKNMLEQIVMEEPIVGMENAFSFADGRRSVWRDIKKAVDSINKILGRNE